MQTPHQRAEAELTALGLTFPETSAGPGWTITRALYVRKKMFAVFGEKGEPLDALTIIVKLPISAEMAEELPFVRPDEPAEATDHPHQCGQRAVGTSNTIGSRRTLARTMTCSRRWARCAGG